MATATGEGAGKAILLGEHAVVYGVPCLVAGLPAGVRCEHQPGPPPLRVEARAWGLSASTSPADQSPPAEALRALGLALAESGRAKGPLGGALKIEAQIPARAGLGSSAALAAAAGRALAGPWEDAALEGVCQASEAVFHGRPSGVDAAVAVRGGVGLFSRGDGWRPVRPGRAFSLVVAQSGPRPATSEMVAQVGARCEADGEAREALLSLGEAATAGARHLETGDLVSLGAQLDAAHRLLADTFALSTPALEALTQAARDAGALGAKLTGAGGGGALVALCLPETAAQVEAALASAPWARRFDLHP